jgi:hypothetical protein
MIHHANTPRQSPGLLRVWQLAALETVGVVEAGVEGTTMSGLQLHSHVFLMFVEA